MSSEDFQLIDVTTIVDLVMKRDFVKIYHQHGAQVDNETEKITLYFREGPKYIQFGNSFVETEIIVKKSRQNKF